MIDTHQHYWRYDAADEGMLAREVKQPAGLVQRLPRLNRDRPRDTRSIHFTFRVCRQEVAADRRHRVVDPWVLHRIVAPEMLVAVDHGIGVPPFALER